MRKLFAKTNTAKRVQKIKAAKQRQREQSLAVRAGTVAPSSSSSPSSETSPTTTTTTTTSSIVSRRSPLDELNATQARSMVVRGIEGTLASAPIVSRQELLRELYARAAELSQIELPLHSVQQLTRRYTETMDRHVAAGREVEHLRTQRAVDVTTSHQLETSVMALQAEVASAMSVTTTRESQLDELQRRLEDAQAVAQTEQSKLLDELADLENARAEEMSKAHIATREKEIANAKIAAAELAARGSQSEMFQTEMDSAEALHSMTTRLKTQRDEMVTLSTEADRARTESDVYRKSLAEVTEERVALAAQVHAHEASLRLLVAQCQRAHVVESQRRVRVAGIASRTGAVHDKLRGQLDGLTKEVLRLRRVGSSREQQFLSTLAEAEESTRRAERAAQRATARGRFMPADAASDDGSEEDDLSGDEDQAERMRQRKLQAKSEAAKTSRRVFADESAKLVEHFGAAIQRAASAKTEVAIVGDMLRFNEQQPMPPPAQSVLAPASLPASPPSKVQAVDDGETEPAQGERDALDALGEEQNHHQQHPRNLPATRASGLAAATFALSEEADDVAVLDDLRADLAALEEEVLRDIEAGGIDAIAKIGETIEVRGSLEEMVIKLQQERANLLTQTCDQTEQMQRMGATMKVLRTRAERSGDAAAAAESALDEAGRAGVAATFAWRSILEVLDVERAQHSDVLQTAQREADVALRQMRREKKRAASQVAQFSESCRLLQNRLDDNELELAKKVREYLKEKGERTTLESKLEELKRSTSRSIEALQKTVETSRGTANETAAKLNASTRSLADVQNQLAAAQRGLSIKRVQGGDLERKLESALEGKTSAEDEVHSLRASVETYKAQTAAAEESRSLQRSQLERQQGAMAARDEQSRRTENELRDKYQALKDEFSQHADAIAAAQRKGVEAEQRYSAFGVASSGGGGGGGEETTAKSKRSCSHTISPPSPPSSALLLPSLQANCKQHPRRGSERSRWRCGLRRSPRRSRRRRWRRR